MAKDEAEKHAAPDEEVRIVDNTEQEHDQEKNQDKTQDQDSTEVVDEQIDKTVSVEGEPAKPVVSLPQPAWKRAYQWLVSHKKVSIPAAVVVVLLVLAAVPFTRYALAGTVLKRQYKVAVIDAQTKQPVSSADVVLAGKKATTDGRGFATLEVPVGDASLTVSKRYYKSASQDVLVPIGKQKQAQEIRLTATGRQVPMVVTNTITKKPVVGAVLSVLDTKAKTDKEGKAVLVVPAGKDSLEVTIEANGYNKTKQTVRVSQSNPKETAASITPSGKMYFLSNKSGKIDVVKANLDGSERTVVVAGTGKEDRYSTSLLASRDWRYLALHAKRDDGKSKLYLIDASTDKMTVMDEGDASFGLSGWSGHSFIYTVTRTNVPITTSGRYALKAFNAQTRKLTTLDQTQALTKSAGGVSYVNYEQLDGVYILEDEVVYVKNWSSTWQYVYYERLLDGERATVNSIKPDGKAKKVIKSYGMKADQDRSISVTARSYGPQEVYLLYNNDQNSPVEEYEDGQVKAVPSMTRDEFYSNQYPTYLLSPSGERTFWTEGRDGKNVFFLGDKHGKNEKQLGALREYNAYGWYGDDYLLVTKNGSELYILHAGNINDGTTPQKITDYYRSRTYDGYGYGYGGL